MLKELFLIGAGIPFFYYSKTKAHLDSDEVVLSSGLLSAIKDFSESTRSDIIESFSTEKEYFLFLKCRHSDKTIVGIFDRKLPIPLAKDSLKKIHDLIEKTAIKDETLPSTDNPEKTELRENISKIVSQLFGSESQAIFIKDLLQDRTNIPLAFLVDINQRELIAHFARPKPLFKQEYVNEYFLLYSTLLRSFSRLELPETYSYFLISSKEYVIASCQSGKVSSITTGAMNTTEQEVLNAAIEMCYYSSLDELVYMSEESSLLNRSLLQKTGDLINEEGESFPSAGGIFLSTLINNVNGFFKRLSRRNFTEFEAIITDGKDIKRLSIRRKNSSDDFIIELFQHKNINNQS